MAKEIKIVRYFVMNDGRTVSEAELTSEEVAEAYKKAAERFLDSFGYIKNSDNESNADT